VNEIAPRVHNSGHWTQTGCVVDQFEQHIRAISGRRLGDGKRYADIKMVNLIGDDLIKNLDTNGSAIHIYGKREIRKGRKMGHINYVIK
jgi:5-(carboxyamino)imidazole ribonucleotide synthase